MIITLRPLTNIENFNADYFRVAPGSFKLNYVTEKNFPNLYKTAYERASELAKFSDSICIATFTDSKEMVYALSERYEENRYVKFVLFNAAETGSEDEAIVKAIFRKDNFTYVKLLKFEKGSIM